MCRTKSVSICLIGYKLFSDILFIKRLARKVLKILPLTYSALQRHRLLMLCYDAKMMQWYGIQISDLR